MNRKHRTISSWVLLAIPLLYGCQSHEEKPRTLRQVYTYPYFEATIDDLPPAEEIQAIVLTGDAPPYMVEGVLLVGSKKALEDIVGHTMPVLLIQDDRQWVERLTTHFRTAERIKDDPGFRSEMTVIFFYAEQRIRCCNRIQVWRDLRVQLPVRAT